MSKRNKRLKKSPVRSKGKRDISVSNAEVLIPEPPISKPHIRDHSILVKLSKNPRFVGAMEWMLTGCFAGGGFIAVLFAVPGLGRLFEAVTYTIASIFLTKEFIPPGTYIPGVLTPPVMFLIVAGFTIYGYRKGSVPPKIEKDKESRSLTEKLFELFFLLIIVLVVIYFRFREDHPETGFIEALTDPFFIVLCVILFAGISFYVFSRHQSPQFLIFVLCSAIACLFVLFLLGLMLYSLIEFWLHALNR